MASSELSVEVVYALAARQKLVRFNVAQGTTVRDAAIRSRLDEEFAGLDLHASTLGIFGKVVAKPDERMVADGDRVEIYRPLLADPKEVRKRRAARAAQAKASD